MAKAKKAAPKAKQSPTKGVAKSMKAKGRC
jgi:hypothetical protein